jgi:predicted NAD/FAD-dependent oxidoreductase
MIALAQPLDIPFDGLRLGGEPLVWAARDSAKPGRPSGGLECWVLHAGSGWSQEHFEDDPAHVTARLVDAFARLLPGPPPSVARAGAHRWPHARVETPLGEPALYDAEARVGLCGDWCLGPRVEAAWLSGRALAERIAAALAR